MHDAGGGGGYGGTNWFAYDVRSMWIIISNQETDSHWELVSGWRRSYELTGEHLTRMKTYRQNLAQAWPPEKNAAAAAYIAQLDEMIGNLQETYDAATANYSTFATALGAISTTRHKLKAIYDQYVANQGRIEQYEAAKAAAPPPSATPTPSPKPQASPVPSTPPVSAAQQEQLNNKARSIMYELSGTLIEARAQIKQPRPYEVQGKRFTGQEKADDIGPPPPPIPLITPQTTADSGAFNVGSGNRSPAPSASPPLGTGVGGPSVGGPILGGISPGTVIAPSAPPTTAPPGPAPIASPVGGGPALPVTPPSILPGSRVPEGPVRGGSTTTPSILGNPNGGKANATKPSAGVPARPLPPGGVIGGTPGMG